MNYHNVEIKMACTSRKQGCVNLLHPQGFCRVGRSSPVCVVTDGHQGQQEDDQGNQHQYQEIESLLHINVIGKVLQPGSLIPDTIGRILCGSGIDTSCNGDQGDGKNNQDGIHKS